MERIVEEELQDLYVCAMNCWICGNTATTGEHMVKRSDLHAVFGKPSQQSPLYYHTSEIRNRPVGSLNARLLKSPARLCADCNNAKTQPFDLAWQKLSAALRQSAPVLAPGSLVRINRVFRYAARQHMLDVHLYFVKLFGCRIVADGVPIPLIPLADAIVHRQAHPHIYLQFGLGSSRNFAGVSQIMGAQLSGRPLGFASWFYEAGPVRVNVMFAEPDQLPDGLKGSWHPRHGTTRIVMADFS